MTLPIRHRTCYRCNFSGDVSLFWKRNDQGEYLKSPWSTVRIDMLRYGHEAAQKSAYFPNKEVCPRCGYDSDSRDEAVEMAYYKRAAAKPQYRGLQPTQQGCLLVILAIPAVSVSVAWMLS